MRRKRSFGFPEFGFNDEFFEEFEQIEEMMRQMLESHFKDFDEKALEAHLPKQRVYGFTMSFGPEGKKQFNELGAVTARQKAVERNAIEPLVDVIERPDSVSIIAELPGVGEEHLQLKAFPKQLSLRVTDPDRLFSKTMTLPAEVLWDSMKHSLKNGILEIVLKKKK